MRARSDWNWSSSRPREVLSFILGFLRLTVARPARIPAVLRDPLSDDVIVDCP
jgi:hypothetical protein